jgi:hypothetical protein
MDLRITDMGASEAAFPLAPTPIKHYYLGDPGEIRKAQQAVAEQGLSQ